MLTQLSQDDILKYWDLVYKGLMESASPDIPIDEFDVEVNLYTAALEGMMQCWLVHEKEKVYGICTTNIQTDSCTRGKTLVITSLYGKEIPASMWKDGFAQLAGYASTQGASKIIAHTSEKGIVDMAKSLGFEVNTVLLKLEVRSGQ